MSSVRSGRVARKASSAAATPLRLPPPTTGKARCSFQELVEPLPHPTQIVLVELLAPVAVMHARIHHELRVDSARPQRLREELGVQYRHVPVVAAAEKDRRRRDLAGMQQ